MDIYAEVPKVVWRDTCVGSLMKHQIWGIQILTIPCMGLLIVFLTVTLQGWTDVYLDLVKTVGSWVIAFFLPIIFIGAFFLLNLTIAVIKSKYSEE